MRGDCWAEKEDGEIRVWIEMREVGEVRMVGKGEMLLCKEGNTKEEMTESLIGMREGRRPIGKVERTLVCREADTRMAASGRAAHVRGKRTLPLHRYKVKGPRAERREARVAAARAACAVHELWTDGDKDRKVREGWPREWMQEVEKATDAIDKIVRGRKARGNEDKRTTGERRGSVEGGPGEAEGDNEDVAGNSTREEEDITTVCESNDTTWGGPKGPLLDARNGNSGRQGSVNCGI